MADEIVVDVERRFPAGPLVSFQTTIPLSPVISVIFGASGAGKTTLLRMLGGFERPDRGMIRFGSEVWFDSENKIFVPPQRRNIGYLFQDYALFPHLTVKENLLYGMKGIEEPRRGERLQDLLELMSLRDFGQRYPRQLSGGQQQRVALARTLATEPRLMLLDEPLSALDAPTRETLRVELRGLLRSLEIPMLIVTHDRNEALSLADELIVLVDGAIRQTGPVERVFSHPVDLGVAKAVGVETVLAASVVESRDGLLTVRVGNTQLVAVDRERADGEIFVCIRAEEVTVDRALEHGVSARNQLRGRITSLVREHPLVRLSIDCGFPLIALVTARAVEELGLGEGEQVIASIKAPAVRVVPRELRISWDSSRYVRS